MSFNISDIESDLHYSTPEDFDMLVIEILKCKEVVNTYNCLAFEHDCDILIESIRTYDILHNALYFYKMSFFDRLGDFETNT